MTARLEEWLFALITACFTWCYRALYKKIKQQKEENEALKDGMRSLLRDRLIDNHQKYLAAGSIPFYARESMLAMYASYSALNGNGTVTHLMEELEELPTKPKEERK